MVIKVSLLILFFFDLHEKVVVPARPDVYLIAFKIRSIAAGTDTYVPTPAHSCYLAYFAISIYI